MTGAAWSAGLMLFDDLTHPATIAALIIEAALFVLAFAAAFRGVFIRSALLLARVVAAVLVVSGVGGVAGMAWELWTFHFPIVLPNAPLGAYAQPTVLGLPAGIAAFGLIAVAALLGFWRPALDGILLILSGLLGLLDSARLRLDPTFPPGNFMTALVTVVLPNLAGGALLLATWRCAARPRGTEPSDPMS